MDNEKTALLVFQMNAFAQIAMFYGLLRLEDYIDTCDYGPMKEGLHRTCCGVDPYEVKAWYDTLIDRAEGSDEKRLLRMVQEGVACIASGEFTDTTRFRLCAPFGEDVLQEMHGLFLEYEKEKNDFSFYLKQFADDPALSSRLEAAFLYEFSWRAGLFTSAVPLNLLVESVRVCSPNIQMRLLHSLPVYTGKDFMRIYRESTDDSSARIEAAKCSIKWFNYMTGNGEYPGN